MFGFKRPMLTVSSQDCANRNRESRLEVLHYLYYHDLHSVASWYVDNANLLNIPRWLIFLVWLFYPETKGLSLEEIDGLFVKGTSSEATDMLAEASEKRHQVETNDTGYIHEEVSPSL